MEIRKGTMKDIEELSALYDELNDYLETHVNYPGWRKDIYPIRDDAEQGIQENSLFVAIVNDRIIGTVILKHQPESGYELVDWHNSFDYKDIFVIYTFAVHPSFLRHGIGKKMIKFVLDYAAKMGIKAVRLDVYEKMFQQFPYMKIWDLSMLERLIQAISNMDQNILGFTRRRYVK